MNHVIDKTDALLELCLLKTSMEHDQLDDAIAYAESLAEILKRMRMEKMAREDGVVKV